MLNTRLISVMTDAKTNIMKLSLSVIASLSITLYLAFLIIPLQRLGSFAGTFESASTLFQFGAIASFSILAVMGCVLFRDKRVIIDRSYISIVAVLAIWCLMSSIWSINQGRSILYSFILVAVLISAVLFWSTQLHVQRTAFFTASAAAIVLIALLAATLPIRERTFGWINANLLGHFAFFMIATSALTGRRVWMPVFAIAATLLLFSQSRSVFGSVLLFVLLLLLYRYLARRFFAILSISFSCISLIVLTSLFSGSIMAAASSFLSSALGVVDPERLQGSALSGREIYMAEGLRIWLDHPLIGYGFRTRTTLLSSAGEYINAHSGAVNALLDIGLIGTMILCIVIIYSIIKFSRVIAVKDDKRYRVACAFLVSYAPVFIFEPNYLNFYHPSSFLFILFIGLAAVDQRPGSVSS